MTQKPAAGARKGRGQDGARARRGWVVAQRSEVLEAVRREVGDLLRTHGSSLSVTEAVWALAARVGPDALDRRLRVTLDLQRAEKALDELVEALPHAPDIDREASTELSTLFESLAARLATAVARFPVIVGRHIERRKPRPFLAETLDSSPNGPWWHGRLTTERELALVSLLVGNYPERAMPGDTSAKVIGRERERMRQARKDNAARAERLARKRAEVDAQHPPHAVDAGDPAFDDM